MRDLAADFRFAVRALAERPAFAIGAILTLALGIGATSAIFGVVDGVVLRPLPFANEGRLVTICEQYPAGSPDWCPISPPNLEDVAARSRTIEAIGIGRSWPYHLDTPDGAREIDGGLASPGLFTALGVRPIAGRLIEQSDMLGRESTVALMSYGMWKTRFGGDRSIVGRTISIDRTPITIVGILPEDFHLPKFEEVELWRPLHIDPRAEQHREWRGFVAYGRLKEGVTLDAARRELAGITEQLRAEHFATTPRWGLTMMPLRDLLVGGVRPNLMLFFGAVGLVLLIGCANVANLLLVRASARRREIALRSALGAGPGRIVRTLLVESFVLALAGATLGLTIAYGATAAFKALAPAGIPRIDQVTVDFRVVLFTLALAVATTFLFRLVPAVRAVRVDLAQALREGGRSGTGRGGRLQAVLVIGELALALTLVAAAGLLTRTFAALAAWNPGFEQRHVLTFTLFAPSASYPQRADVVRLWDAVEREVKAVPGVTAVGSASAGPMFGGRETWEMEIQGRTGPFRSSVRWYDVSPGFFASLGVPLVRGRDFDSRDAIGAPHTGLVNETLANRFWPDEDPIGKTLVFGVGDDRETFQVIGVVRDVPPLDPGQPIEPQLYWSNRQLPRPFSFFVARTSVPPATVVSALRSRIQGIDRDLELGSPLTLPERVDMALRKPRFSMLLVGSFGATALLLAAIGIYGLVAYVVAQRTREIGIRLALGAQREGIVRQVLGGALRLAAIGVVLGVLGAVVAGRGMRSLLAGVGSVDAVTIGVSALVLLAVAVGAALVPAWRASRVDPVVTLGAE